MDYKPNKTTFLTGLIVKICYSRWTPCYVRKHLLKLVGIKFKNIKSVFIGSNVSIDTHYPHFLSIGENVQITQGVKILCHSVDLHSENFRGHTCHKVEIGDNVFIGINSIISAGVKISNNTVIGSGSVVINDCEKEGIYAGVPAKFIKSIK
jgi:acetyltransferase-like isoleucine patch superfamily enzyme